jgi:amino acid transporter
MTLAVWMSDGWEVSASTSEEVADANSASGRGGITGLIASTLILVACMFAYMHLGTIAGFTSNASDALAYVGDALGGTWWRPLIVITVLLSTLTTLWTTVLYLSRSVYAMGRDHVLPSKLGVLDARNEPLTALTIITIVTILFELVTGLSKSANEQLQLVLNASSVFLGLLFVLTALAAVRRFLGTRVERLSGVVLPAVGAVALGGVLIATIALEDRVLAAYAWGGLFLGIPFSLLRGRA